MLSNVSPCVRVCVSVCLSDIGFRVDPQPYIMLLVFGQAALSQLDVLAALAEFPTNAGGPTCRPVLLPPGTPGEGVVLQLKSMWHPCARPGGNGAVVPNDITLG